MTTPDVRIVKNAGRGQLIIQIVREQLSSTLVHIVLHGKQFCCRLADDEIDNVLILLCLQEAVFLKEFNFCFYIHRGNTQVIGNLVNGLCRITHTVADVLSQCGTKKLVGRFFAYGTVDAIGVEFNRVKLEFACFSHRIHTSFQFFFSFKQVPLDSAERNIQFPSNICLFAIFKIIRDHYSSLQLRKVSNLSLETMDSVTIVVGVQLRVRICNQLRNLINRNTDHTFRSITIIVAERVMGNGPDELSHVRNVILDKERTERSYRNLLRQILCIVNAFTPLQSKSEYRFQVFSYDFLYVLSVHLFAPH